MDADGLTDPICHTPVDETSACRFVHGGALFFFCSEACRTRFESDPSRWAVANMLGGLRARPPLARAVVREDAPAAQPVAAAAGEPDLDIELDVHPGDIEPTLPVTSKPDQEALPTLTQEVSMPDVDIGVTHAAAKVLAPGRFPVLMDADEPPPDDPSWDSLPEPQASMDPVAAGEHSVLTPLVAWLEKHSAAVCCRDMLKLYRAVATQQPGLTRYALYREVVVARTGNDSATADDILRMAQESFASRPVRRELTFRDVVHYLAATEFLASHPDSRWVHSDMRRIVHSAIPHHL